MADHTHLNLLQLEDMARKFDLPEEMSARFARESLNCEKSGLSFQHYAPGFRAPFGHRHAEEEELYVVAEGSGRIKLDDEILELKHWDAVRVGPGVTRAVEAGPNGMTLLAFGAPGLGNADAEQLPDWWKD